ncbi:hypothetical protein ACJX0J_033507, partial [Zea mays]
NNKCSFIPLTTIYLGGWGGETTTIEAKPVKPIDIQSTTRLIEWATDSGSCMFQVWIMYHIMLHLCTFPTFFFKKKKMTHPIKEQYHNHIMLQV